VLGAVAALLINLALGHLYCRARPFLVLDVRPLPAQAVDSSLFSDHLSVAGADDPDERAILFVHHGRSSYSDANR
jgi:hypothetical protein